MKKATGTYSLSPKMVQTLTEWRNLGIYIVPSEGFFVWFSGTPQELCFHVLRKIIIPPVTPQDDISWHYEQGLLTFEGLYLSLGSTE